MWNLCKCNYWLIIEVTKQSIYYSASSLYMFRVSITHITSTQNCNYSLRYFTATSLQRDQAWPRWREVAAKKIWPIPKAVVTVVCTPNDGCSWHPKHVERTCRIINRLFCVASRLTIINIYARVMSYLLTPWCRVFLQKPTGLQLVKKFPAFHGTRKFITALTSVRHLSLSWASPIQSIYPHSYSRRSILILSTHLRLGLPSGLLPSGFPTKKLFV